MRYFSRIGGTFIVAIALCHSAFAGDNDPLRFAEPERNWTDASGKYQIAASLVGYHDRTLILESANEKQIRISVDNISKSDQRYTLNRVSQARRKSKPIQPRSASERKATQAAAPEKLASPSRPALQNTSKLYGIDWHPIEQAERVATIEKKPILWFRVLGDMTGFM